MTSTDTYSSVAKFLHWAIAILMMALVLGGAVMTNFNLPDTMKSAAVQSHKLAGFLVLFLVIIRVYWTLTRPSPPLPSTTPVSQKIVARLTHFILYAAMIVIPIAGWAFVSASDSNSLVAQSLVPIPNLPVENSEASASFFRSIHEAGAWIFFLLLIVHVGAAAFHHYVKKDSVFLRMLSLKDGASGKLAVPIILGLAALYFAGLFAIPALAGG